MPWAWRWRSISPSTPWLRTASTSKPRAATPISAATLDNSLILTTYTSVLSANSQPVTPLHLDLDNEIPLGMGCGSSAAALLAGVLLADHFGDLNWTSQQILEEACRREGHPDNVAACYLGGMTASSE